MKAILAGTVCSIIVTTSFHGNEFFRTLLYLLYWNSSNQKSNARRCQEKSETMPQYKMTYFPLRGRGDMIRYIFHYANQPFEEETVTLEDWPNKKLTFPFKQLPVLDADGKRMNQSVAIARHLANKFNLTGKSDFDHQQCDAYVDGVQDLWPKLVPAIVARLFQKDEKAAKENFAKFKEESFKPFMDRYEKFLEENNTGCLVGNQITWADLVLVEWLDRMDGCFEKGVYAGHKRLEALVKKVQDHPGIKKMIIQRPKYPL